MQRVSQFLLLTAESARLALTYTLYVQIKGVPDDPATNWLKASAAFGPRIIVSDAS